MKHNVMLTIASLLSIVLMTFHFTDDVLREGGMAVRGAWNLIAVLILLVWLYGTLVLAERRSGYIIMLIGSLLALLPYPLGARTMEPEMGPAPVVPGKQVRPLASNADPRASPNTPYWAGDTPPADHHDPLRCFQGVACCEFRCELPLQDSNLVRGAKRPLFALQRVTARDASPCGAAFSARRVGRPTRAVVGSNPTGGSVPLTP